VQDQTTSKRLLFITAVPIIKLFAWGEGDSGEQCYEIRRAEACADHHALVNAGERKIV
jgi:hypothetical protein